MAVPRSPDSSPQQTARELANVLKYGSLPLSFESSEAETVSATLGLTSLRAGLIAGAVGLALVLLYSLLYYRVLGVLIALSLVASGAMVYAILVLLGRYIGYTLDLAGIAGLIIGIGMTADSFVVFFERIKDEIRDGRSFRSAVPRGWARARKTILSGNAVTFLAAAVLYVLAVGQVKGFAFTLGLTTILDVVVVFLVTWPIVYIASKSPTMAKPSAQRSGCGAADRPRTTSGRTRDGTGVNEMAAKNKDSDDLTTEAVEAPDLESTAAPRHGFFIRLYTGTGAFEVIGKRKLWFTISGLIVAVALVGHSDSRIHLRHRFRGRHQGVDAGAGRIGQRHHPAGRRRVQQVDGQGSRSGGHRRQRRFGHRPDPFGDPDQRGDREAARALFDAFEPRGADGKPSKQAISDSAVSETWGGQITEKALIALVVFLALAAIYITVRYERYMAIAALATLVFDLVVTAGVYSIVGFEVTPATVIGLLTILGFSLYDTVIVFDKVEENTHGFEHTTRRTFAEQANLAVNQTFMRSINTSLISVLPIIALMVIAVWLLGVGTLMDLALVQLVGVIVGTYSSIYFATPLLVTLRERTELVRTHTRRVLNRRKRKRREADGYRRCRLDARGGQSPGNGGGGEYYCRTRQARAWRAADDQPDRTTVG